MTELEQGRRTFDNGVCVDLAPTVRHLSQVATTDADLLFRCPECCECEACGLAGHGLGMLWSRSPAQAGQAARS
jgi:hypothetical protein